MGGWEVRGGTRMLWERESEEEEDLGRGGGGWAGRGETGGLLFGRRLGGGGRASCLCSSSYSSSALSHLVRLREEVLICVRENRNVAA